jgi:tetratricopeptide (TPR) repeat protein
LALKIDKEAVLEFVIKKKDPLFIGLLVLVLVIGGWYLYGPTSESVDQIIVDVLKNPQSGAGGVKEEPLLSADIVTDLTSKPSLAVYTLEKNPFGSPEDQLRMRQSVEEAYNQGVQLYTAGDFEKAVQQFEKVILMDVTESRIEYPRLPSEYKRLAQQQYAKQNLDKILTQVNADIQTGDTALSQNKPTEAVQAYTVALNELSEIIQSDETGDVIGKDKISMVKDLHQTVLNKSYDLRRKTLLSDLTREMTQAQTQLQGQDYITMLRLLGNLNRIQPEINQIDPNGDLITVSTRDRLTTLIQNLQNKIKENVATLGTQAETQFTDALAAQDHVKAQEAILALTQVPSFSPENSTEIQTKLKDFVLRRAELVITLAEKFADSQQVLMTTNKTDQLDLNTKAAWQQELTNLRMRAGKELSSTLSNQISSVETKLRALRLPPQLTELYQFNSVVLTKTGFVKIDFVQKGSNQQAKPLMLKKGQSDNRTKITLNQVDTDNGFVILSKPGYTDTRVELTIEN